MTVLKRTQPDAFPFQDFFLVCGQDHQGQSSSIFAIDFSGASNSPPLQTAALFASVQQAEKNQVNKLSRQIQRLRHLTTLLTSYLQGIPAFTHFLQPGLPLSHLVELITIIVSRCSGARTASLPSSLLTVSVLLDSGCKPVCPSIPRMEENVSVERATTQRSRPY